ncbi:programmed cell death protein 2-like isoform X2 [Melopsittacus undulatus]|uniref:programmed cell death protein 2-like isoform X2 n=1 Tax=Melopsittacus undulatus TaxID=13146 RepID=UPI0012434FA4|nr:programmed cell death protein 2-like isoform X2 [Melopsittacus undulatus]
MAVKPVVLLGLRDAAMVGLCRGSGQDPAWATSKLGGSADWVPSVRAAEPRCGVCGRLLAQLVQVYCPLEGSPCHRLANVFACTGTGCAGDARSWKVLRSQYLQTQEKETQDYSLKQKQESHFTAKDWCDEADDWGVSDGAETPACTPLQLLGLNEAVSSSLSREVECASQLQQLCLFEAMDSGSLNTHSPVSEGMVMETSGSAPVFQPFYISVVDEEDYTGFLDADHADKLLKEYQQREGVDLKQLMSERYSWGGQPLFITCPPDNFSKCIPACSNCGSNRIFEFQLMPALVSILQSDSGLSVEFGTALVYTCERSCWPTDHHTPLEEFIFVQEDPDQRLFK